MVAKWAPLSVFAVLLALQSVEVVARTLEDGRKFLIENKDRPGVVTLDSGLQYKILTKGHGKWLATLNSTAKFHYAGTTLNLTTDFLDKHESEWETFESSWKDGESKFWQVRMMTEGFRTALTMMVEGSKWEIYVPSHLGYGNTKAGGKMIKPNEMLIFRIEMLGMEDYIIKAKCDPASLDYCEDDEVKFIGEWKEKSLKELETKTKGLKKKAGYSLKKEEKENFGKQIRILKEMIETRKGGGKDKKGRKIKRSQEL